MMMSEEHVIIGAQLGKAREFLGLLPGDVASRLQVQEEDIIDWETAETRPSLRHLERLGELYGRELDYFLRETPEPPVHIQFRSTRKQSFTELPQEVRVVLAQFDELCRTAYEVEMTLGKARQPEVERVREAKSPVDLARQHRTLMGLADKPAAKLRDCLTHKGIRVFELPVPGNQFSGFSYWHTTYGPSVLVNETDLRGRKNFTLAHEYAHILYGHEPSVCDVSEVTGLRLGEEERLCNTFAVELLLPAGPLTSDFQRRGLPGTPTVQEVGKLAGRWCVSIQAMFYRLEAIGLVDRGHSESVFRFYVPEPPRVKRTKGWKWRKRRRMLGDAFVAGVIEAYQEGNISLGKLAHSLGVPIREALEIAEGYRKT